jgi:hypothetical protein
MPSLVKEVDPMTSFRTRAGWRIVSCKAIAPPML